MHNYQGWFLVILGFLYMMKPDVFVRSGWTRVRSVRQQMTPKQQRQLGFILGAMTIYLGVHILMK